MTLPQLLAEHGYLVVLAGALLEGETILVLAGFAAHQGYLSLPLVIAVAFVGGVLGDQIFFFIGHHFGVRLLRRWPRLTQRAERVERLLLRHHAPLIIGVRFMYGLRIVGPIVIGMSAVPARRFLLFNLIGAAIWAPLVAGVGYLFGESLTLMLVDVEHYEGIAVGVLVLLVAGVGLWHRRRAKRHR